MGRQPIHLTIAARTSASAQSLAMEPVAFHWFAEPFDRAARLTGHSEK
jgi:hypothetical protein